MLTLALTLVCGPGPSLTEAAEPPRIPTSFTEVAATALAASFAQEADDDIQEDGRGRGNAGGPLVNMSGDLVGIGTLVAGDGSAYAIPSKTLRRIALAPGDVVTLKLSRGGRALVVSATLGEEPDGMPLRPDARLAKRRFGIEVRPVNPTAGAVASDVDLWGSAGRAGIKPGDVIREVNGHPIESLADFQTAVSALSPGAPVLMRVQRGNVVLYVVIDATS